MSDLISGRDAWLANFDGKYVEYRRAGDNGRWFDFGKEEWVNEELKSDTYEYRLKPQTITINGVEIAKPELRPQSNNCDGTFILRIGCKEFHYKTEDEYIKARDLLWSIFEG